MSEWIDIALEEGIRFFVTSLGKPDWVCERVHAVGGVVYHDVTNRFHAKKGIDCGVDGLICVNDRAGGHLGQMSMEEMYTDLSDLGLPLICAGGVGSEKELKEAEIKKEKNEKKLKIFLLPKDSDDEKNTIVEIRAGTGGLEATLFVADLFRMYEKVCSKKKWQLEIINISKSEAGGFKEVIFLVNGNDIYSYLKYESGVHRVQRIPKTETQGRVHTLSLIHI